MLKEFTCIVCPNGCEIEAETKPTGEIVAVKGNLCPRGAEYVRQEMTDPRRTIASSVAVEGGVLPLCSVRLDKPVPKARLFDVMAEIAKVHLRAPTQIGTVALENVLGLGSNVIVTKNVAAAAEEQA